MNIEDPLRVPAINRVNEIRTKPRATHQEKMMEKTAEWHARIREIDQILEAGGPMDHEALVAERRQLKQNVAAADIDQPEAL